MLLYLGESVFVDHFNVTDPVKHRFAFEDPETRNSGSRRNGVSGMRVAVKECPGPVLAHKGIVHWLAAHRGVLPLKDRRLFSI